MDQDDLRLSRIDTLWSVVRQANGSRGDETRRAQQDLLDRYGGAVRRYLLASLRNADAADEVFQEFSLKLVSGAFERARAENGRFRGFLKTTLYHLIVDYQRRSNRGAKQALVEDPPDRAADEGRQQGRLEEEDRAFTNSWREDLLAKGWSALEQTERTTGTPYYAALRFRSAHPDLHSPEIAAELGKTLKKPLTSSSVRVLIHRAREMLAEHMLDLVLDSLDNASLDEAEQELIDLNLIEYCRPALKRRRGEPEEEPAN